MLTKPIGDALHTRGSAKFYRDDRQLPGIEVWLDRSELRGGDAAKVAARDRAYEKM